MKKIYSLTLISIFSLNLYCQIHWEKHPDNPVLTPGSTGEWDEVVVVSESVIYFDNIYHMWYSGKDLNDTVRIGHATSPDGITWTKDPNNPVMDVGPKGDWDDLLVNAGGVLVIDSIFHMWYSGDTGPSDNSSFQLGHATSPDGIVWTKDANNPILDKGPAGDWDDTWAAFGRVVYTDGTFQMWYVGWDGTDDHAITGHATSSDGISWTKDPQNPVLTAGDWDSPRCWNESVIFDGSKYQMWYAGGKWLNTVIGFATSEDGSKWEKFDEPVLRKGPAGSWDEKTVMRSCVLFDSSEYKYKMWYTGVSTTGVLGVGYAESEKTGTIIPETLVLSDFIKVYPNPATDLLTIEVDKPGQHSIKITSVNGQLIYSTKMKGGSLHLDLSSFLKGVYFITVRSRDYVKTEKVSKL